MVKVFSMTARGLGKSHEDLAWKIDYFFCSSWEKVEYLKAVASKTIFEHIKCRLDAGIDLKIHSTTKGFAQSVDDMLCSKFHYACGSCRFMFCLSTQDVINAISRAVIISDPVSYLEGTYGDQSDGVVKQLFCCILCQESVPKTWIVSCFAGCQLAIKVGTRVVDRLGAAIKADLNWKWRDGCLKCDFST